MTSFEKHGCEAGINDITYITCINYMLQYPTLYEPMLRHIAYFYDLI